MEADLVYYRRRSAEEHAAATVARDMKVREIHLELAAAYEQRTTMLEAAHVNTRLHVVNAV